MKIAEINYGTHGSTGTIMLSIATCAREQGHDVYTFSKRRNAIAPEGHIYFGSEAESAINRVLSMITGISDAWLGIGTRELIRKLEKIKPDIIHLHNLHGWYINIPMLFRYIKEHNIPVVWTLHDCWSFTGQCSHFVMEKCDKWKTGCYSCPRYRIYPHTWVDRTRKMWKLKKRWFCGVDNLTIVTPSEWLAGLARQSFLKEYPIKVIHNGIDLSVFKPTPGDFRNRNKLEGKKVVLGVASGWGYRKGLDVFMELSKRLDRNDYQIVLVGTDSAVDKLLPKDILSIHRTQDQNELAEIYSAADVFVNPTREENYPTVNMEAIACGVPVVTFDTGGSSECIDLKSGSVVDVNDMDALMREIKRKCIEKNDITDACRAKAQQHERNLCFERYISLFCQLRQL